jgi:hypothetical protein
MSKDWLSRHILLIFDSPEAPSRALFATSHQPLGLTCAFQYPTDPEATSLSTRMLYFVGAELPTGMRLENGTEHALDASWRTSLQKGLPTLPTIHKETTAHKIRTPACRNNLCHQFRRMSSSGTSPWIGACDFCATSRYIRRPPERWTR